MLLFMDDFATADILPAAVGRRMGGVTITPQELNVPCSGT